MKATPIADYALLSDRHSAALVSRDGSIDWLCFPRFDSPSVFGRLLGDNAGHWSIQAASTTNVARRYVDRTMVLETTFRTSTGTIVLTDALATGYGNRGHELGQGAPHLLLRRATCVEGEVELTLEYVPRPEYGLVHPLFDPVDGGMAAFGGADVLVLSSPSALTVDQSGVSGQLNLRLGETAAFALHHAKRADRGSAKVWSQSEIGARLDDTVAAWESWSEMHQAYVGPGETWYTRADGCSRPSPLPPPAPSARRRPLLFPRWWAAPETGTTATPGSATLPSPSKLCGWPPAPTKPTSSSST